MTSRQAWDMVNECDTHEKVREAVSLLMEDDEITIADYNELMKALAYISRELYRH